MCWWTITVMSVILIASLLMIPVASVEEGFVSYVVYGPGGWFGAPPGYGRGWVPNGGHWMAWRRRHRFNGPCPGPWCPSYY